MGDVFQVRRGYQNLKRPFNSPSRIYIFDSISKICLQRQEEHPESIKKSFRYFDSERKGFEPLVQLLVRFISNEVLSATQSSLQIVKGFYRTKFYCLHFDF